MSLTSLEFSILMWLYYDPIFLEHDTGGHPECAGRLPPIVQHIEQRGRDAPWRRETWEPVSDERLYRVHDPHYVRGLKNFISQGRRQVEADTVVSDRSYDVARMAAGAVCDAVQRVVRGDDPRAFCLVRPPGHHALTNGPMGFCLFNNIAVAARMATSELEMERVMIVDWDVHHGNGTQDTFWEDPHVGFLSIHRWPFYPGTGSAEETGSGDGLGTIVNLPTAFGTPRGDYIQKFTSELERFASRIKPQLVLVSAGFDSHRADPIGSLGLESEDFGPLTEAVEQVAAAYAGGKLVSVLEGGYHPEALAECVGVHLDRLASGASESG